MSKKIVTTMLLLLGAALASNCGGGSDGAASNGDGGMGPGSAGSPGEAGEPSTGGTKGGTMSGAGTSAGGMGDAGHAPTAGSGEVEGGATGTAGEGGLAGASGEGGAGGADSVSICPESIVDYHKLYAEAICRKRVQCCTNNETEACMKEVSEALAKIYPDLAKAGQEGTAAPNCQALEQCVAAIDAADCSAWPLEMPTMYGVPAGEPACRNIIEGKLAPNQACTSLEHSYQCDNGFCNGEETFTCIAFAADGEACGDTTACNFTTSYCSASNKCAPRGPNGAACTNGDECMSRRCDTQDTGQCLAPASNQCEFVPAGACSFGRGPLRDNPAWPLLVVGLVLGAGARRRSRERRQP